MKKLPVPENIPLRWELYRGFGRPELIRTLIITGTVLVVSVAFCFVSDWSASKIAATMTVIITLFFCSGLFGKMENNQSIYDFLKRGRRYRKEQQTFWYKREEEQIWYVPTEESSR